MTLPFLSLFVPWTLVTHRQAIMLESALDLTSRTHRLCWRWVVCMYDSKASSVHQYTSSSMCVESGNTCDSGEGLTLLLPLFALPHFTNPGYTVMGKVTMTKLSVFHTDFRSTRARDSFQPIRDAHVINPLTRFVINLNRTLTGPHIWILKLPTL